MAPRPQTERILSRKELLGVQSSLVAVEHDGVEGTYPTAYADCRLEKNRFPPVAAIQQLVAAWKVLRKFRKRLAGRFPRDRLLFLRAFGGSVHYQGVNHISDHELERYHLGMLDRAELAVVEEHLLVCSDCIDAAVEAAQYVDTIRAGIITGNLDS